MSDLYTVVVFITLFTLIISIMEVISNGLVSQKNKNEIIAVSLVIGIAVIGEWIGVETNGAASSLILLHKAAKLVEFCAVPAIGVTAAIAYGKVKRIRLAYVFIACHAVFEIWAMLNGWVFFIDSDNIYHRGSLYWIYIAAFIFSVLYCFICMVIGYKNYQARFNGVMALVMCLLAFGVSVQMVNSEIRVDYLCAVIGNIFLYNNRGSIVNQVDKTTRLLNRRCFDRKAESVKSNVCVMVFDINKFKIINDTYGHAVGDECLKDVGKIIFSVYGKHGQCYRIGGDELCVILNKYFENPEKLNARLHREAAKLRPKYGDIFGISVGYAYCDGSKTTFAEAFKKADEMMYENKKINF